MTAPGHAVLYRKLLGAEWDRLPEPIQAMHDVREHIVASGIATIDRGKGLLSRIVGAIIGFPPAGDGVAVTVSFRRDGEREFWERDFGGKTLCSVIEAGRGRFEGFQCERFGPLAFGIELRVADQRLILIPRGWTAFGLPMPQALLPQGDAYEHAQDGRFNFHVEIKLPLIGLIVRYHGWLVPQIRSCLQRHLAPGWV